LLLQIGAALATGNRALVLAADDIQSLLAKMPAALRGEIDKSRDLASAEVDVVLFEGDSDALMKLAMDVAQRGGPIVPVYGISREALASGSEDYALEWLVHEHSVSTNTAAAGGNASLMTIG